ncbi:ribonuclease H-like domain-containing protein, partial [Pterulicium gracile]
IVYCDGACPNNGNPGAIAGVGVWWGGGDSRNLSERCPGPQTNNRAELIAIIRVLEIAPAARSLTIKTDSKYCIQSIVDWLPRWRTNGFKLANGKPAQNQPLIKYLDALMQNRRAKGQRVELFHVRGHQGETGNEGADFLANRG